MTLNLLMVNKWGSWISADHRVVSIPSGTIMTDESAKGLLISTPDGRGMLVYAGIGILRYTVTISDWMRETLRGDTRTIEQTLVALSDNANRDIAPVARAMNLRHVFTGVVEYNSGERFVVQLRNFHTETSPVLDRFLSAVQKFEGYPIMAALGAHHAVHPDDIALIRKANRKKPRKPHEFDDLLARVNRRTAKRTPFVSPTCMTSYMEPGDTSIGSRMHGDTGNNKVVILPHLLNGIDMTDRMRGLMAMNEAMDRGEPFSAHVTDQELADSVTPRNRLGPTRRA